MNLELWAATVESVAIRGQDTSLGDVEERDAHFAGGALPPPAAASAVERVCSAKLRIKSEKADA